MSFAWFVARRYLTARRRQAFISLISAVSVVGVGVGVMALIIALALMTGVQTELQDRLVGSAAHVYVTDLDGSGFDEAVRAQLTVDGVEGMAPAISDFVMLQVGGSTSPAMLKGIDPAAERSVSGIEQAMQSGTLDALTDPESRSNGLVVGADLARKLGVGLGDTVWVYTTAQVSTPMGATQRKRPMEIVGIFRFGIFEIDDGQAYVSLDAAGSLLDRDVDRMQLRLANMDTAPAVRDRLQEALGPGYYVQDWTQLNGQLYAALWLEKVAISLTIGLIVMVAALNIVASLVLLVMEKTRDIAILRTIGAPASVIRRIFVLQGLAIGCLGTGIGTVLGLAVSFVADRFQLIRLPSEVYQISHLPFRVEPLDVALVVVSAVLVCLLATLYPSRQAGRIDPAEALRNQ